MWMIPSLFLMAMSAILQPPINYCVADDIPSARSVRVALDSPKGWNESLHELGTRLAENCQISDISIEFGEVPYGYTAWADQIGLDLGLCEITLGTKWQVLPAPARQSIVYHEIGHCLGLLDGEGTIMSNAPGYPRVPREAKQLLLERWPRDHPVNP